MITTWLLWLITQILNILVSKATTAIAQYAGKLEEDKQRGEVNDANQKAYDEAVDRADRIKRAGELLNRATVPH